MASPQELSSSRSVSHGRSSAAPVKVLASDELFPTICAFLPGRPTWLREFERQDGPLIEELQLTVAAKKGSGAPGLLPCLVILQHDMRALQRLWVLHKQPQFRKDAKLWFDSAMHDAATSGNLEALQWLHATTGDMCESSALSMAASSGFADVVRWLLSHLSKIDVESAELAMAKAAASGRLEVLKAFHEWRADACTSQMMDLAAANGHLDIVQFLDKHGSQGCTTDAVDKAAENGHVDVVKWLLVNRSEGFTPAGLRGAVANRHLAVVQYVWEEHRHQGGSDDDKTSVITDGVRSGVPDAIRHRDLAMLRYLHENMGEAAFPPYALAQAAMDSHDLAVFRFLHGTARPRDDVEDALRRAIHDPEIMQYLLQHESFSVDAMAKVLPFAIAIKDKNVSEPNAMALQIAIAQQRERDAAATDANMFVVPTATAKASASTSGHRGKAKARRASPPPRTQAFLAPPTPADESKGPADATVAAFAASTSN